MDSSIIMDYKLAVNATHIQKQPTGLGVLTESLLLELIPLVWDCELRVYSNSSLLKTQYPDQIELVNYNISPDLGFRGNLGRLFWEQTILAQSLVKDKFSLVYTTVPEGIIFGGIKQIMTFHDIIPVRFPEIHPKIKYYYYYILPWIIKNTTAFICDSEYTKQDIIDYYQIINKPIYVVYPGYDDQVFYPRDESIIKSRYGWQDYILYVGDLKPYKNVGRCIEAMSQVNVPDLKLVICGKCDDQFYPDLVKLVAKLGLQERVVFLGYVSKEDLPLLYSEALGLVFCSLYEGFGLPVLEAMGSGCPVIASRLTSIPEVGGNAVYYVDAMSVDSIAEGILRLFTDFELRRKLRELGLERAKLFGWKKMAMGVLEVLLEYADEDYKR